MSSVKSDETVGLGAAILHQCLHGYDQGHRLVSSSCVLPAEAERAMLALTDAPSSDQSLGFEECVTAYPLPGTRFFSFARTWPAAEMPRPGCVWTHSLLIHVADLAHVDDIGRLERLLKRPDATRPNFEEYKRTLRLEIGEVRRIRTESLSRWHRQTLEALTRILYVLYNQSATEREPVVLLTDEPQEHEHLLIAVWNQQWPRLRRRFSFCTGATAPKSLNAQPLQLQCGPPSSQRAWTRWARNPRFIVPFHSSSTREGRDPYEWSVKELVRGATHRHYEGVPADGDEGKDNSIGGDFESLRPLADVHWTAESENTQWLTVLVEDLLAEEGALDAPRGEVVRVGQKVFSLPSFRDFAAQFAVDIGQPARGAMRNLAIVYHQLRETLRIGAEDATDRPVQWTEFGVERSSYVQYARLLSVACDAFPHAKDARKLKRGLFGEYEGEVSAFPLPTEVERLAVLAVEHRVASAFSERELRLFERARNVGATDTADAATLLRILQKRHPAKAGAEVVRGLAAGVHREAALQLSSEFAGFWYQVAHERPLLMADPAIWMGSRSVRKQSLDALEVLRREESTGEASLSSDLCDAIVQSSLGADSGNIGTEHETLATDLARALGGRAITSFLNVAAWHDVAEMTSTGWQQVLITNSGKARDWLVESNHEGSAPRNQGLAAVLTAMDPAELNVSELWTNLSELADKLHDHRFAVSRGGLDLAVALAAVAFDEVLPTAAPLLAAAFPVIHKEALSGSLSSRSWQILGRRAPASHWSREWDYAERLRVALIASFSRKGWPPADFVRALGDTDALRLTVQLATESDAGRRLLRLARHSIRTREVAVTARQEETFERASDRKREGFFDWLDRVFG